MDVDPMVSRHESRQMGLLCYCEICGNLQITFV